MAAANNVPGSKPLHPSARLLSKAKTLLLQTFAPIRSVYEKSCHESLQTFNFFHNYCALLKTGLCGSIKLRENLKIATFCRNFSHVRYYGDESCSKSFQTFVFDTNRALGCTSLQTLATFCHGQKLRQKLSGGTSANHAKHLHPLAHVDPLPPHTHARSPRQMKYPVRNDEMDCR